MQNRVGKESGVLDQSGHIQAVVPTSCDSLIRLPRRLQMWQLYSSVTLFFSFL